MLTSRNASFQSGYLGMGAAGSPTGIAPNSVLIPYMKSAIATNTSAASEAGRATPSGMLLPSRNAYAPDTYNRLYTGIPTQVGI
jgi:hypothetical protein